MESLPVRRPAGAPSRDLGGLEVFASVRSGPGQRVRSSEHSLSPFSPDVHGPERSFLRGRDPGRSNEDYMRLSEAWFGQQDELVGILFDGFTEAARDTCVGTDQAKELRCPPVRLDTEVCGRRPGLLSLLAPQVSSSYDVWQTFRITV